SLRPFTLAAPYRSSSSTTKLHPLSLHDALPIYTDRRRADRPRRRGWRSGAGLRGSHVAWRPRAGSDRAHRRPPAAPGCGTRALRGTVPLRYRLGTGRFDDRGIPATERRIIMRKLIAFAVLAAAIVAIIAIPAAANPP